jgi:hypothetical protein
MEDGINVRYNAILYLPSSILVFSPAQKIVPNLCVISVSGAFNIQLISRQLVVKPLRAIRLKRGG